MHFTGFLPGISALRAAFAGLALAGALLPPMSRAGPVLPAQAGLNGQIAETAPTPYSPPAADVPVPLPTLKPGSAAGSAPEIAAPAPAAPLPGEPPAASAGSLAAPPLAAGDSGQNSQAGAGRSAGETKIGLAQAQKMAQILADKFSQIRVMMGEFVQFDPRGAMTTGTFYLERPGRILFDYKDSPLRVICDGNVIAVNNRKLRSWSLYELEKSPLNLLLADKITIANGRLLEFTQEPKAVTLVLGDTTGRARIRMIFDAQTYELKQWTMSENGQDTTIQVLNTRTDIEFADNMFNIDYYRFPERYKK